jgi:glycosyltransferase involved in cell wall biosynthesis/5'(3')-deoxyribonucleotidase
VLSPKNGAFGARFLESGASVRVGDIEDLLHGIRNVFCVVCNTIMTADIVVAMSNRCLPTIWILHEWWSDEMIKQSLELRGYTGLTLETVKEAMVCATKIVCVCQSQKDFYNPAAPTSVIYVGVPDPISNHNKPEEAVVSLECAINDAVAENGDATTILSRVRSYTSTESEDSKPFTFLCLGIICPRKNQHWTVQLFKRFARNKPNLRLQIVGARYSRDYEVKYLEKVKAEAGDDPRIEIFDVTNQVDDYYNTADCLILTSLNEVTPMVISEAMSRGIPVLTTNIAGIEEMITDGVEGFHFKPNDNLNALQSMETIYSNEPLRQRMSRAARLRYETTFSQEAMTQSFRDLLLSVAPPVILVDMDGTLVDWDAGFYDQWHNRCSIDRTRSFYMEDCVLNPVYREAAIELVYSQGFFGGLPWMEGAETALKEMKEAGLQVRIVTSPLRGSKYCAQEKIDWVVTHLGEEWLDDLIICYDKVRNFIELINLLLF